MPYVGHNPRLARQNGPRPAGRNYGFSGVSIGGPAPWSAGSSGATGTPRSAPTPTKPAGGGKTDPLLEARRSATIMEYVDKYMATGLSYEEARDRVARNLMKSGNLPLKDLEAARKRVHDSWGKAPAHPGSRPKPEPVTPTSLAGPSVPSSAMRPPPAAPRPFTEEESLLGPSPGPAVGSGRMDTLLDVGGPRLRNPSDPSQFDPRPQLTSAPPPNPTPTAPPVPIGTSFSSDWDKLGAWAGRQYDKLPSTDSINSTLSDAGKFISRNTPNTEDVADLLLSPANSIKSVYDYGNNQVDRLFRRARDYFTN